MPDRQPLDSSEKLRAVIATADGRAARAECVIVDGTAVVRAHDGQLYIVSNEWLQQIVAAHARLQLALAQLATYPDPKDAPGATDSPQLKTGNSP